MRHLWHNSLEARANGRAKNSEMIHVTFGANPYVTFSRDHFSKFTHPHHLSLTSLPPFLSPSPLPIFSPSLPFPPSYSPYTLPPNHPLNLSTSPSLIADSSVPNLAMTSPVKLPFAAAFVPGLSPGASSMSWLRRRASFSGGVGSQLGLGEGREKEEGRGKGKKKGQGGRGGRVREWGCGR